MDVPVYIVHDEAGMFSKVVSSLVLLPALLSAQTGRDLHDWMELQSIRKGAGISVQTRNGKSLKGDFLESRGSGITLSKKSRTVTVDRPDVIRVYVEIPRGRAKPALVGVAVGGGLGVAAGAALYSKGDIVGSVVPIGMVIGAAAGLLIGALGGHNSDLVLVYAVAPGGVAHRDQAER